MKLNQSIRHSATLSVVAAALILFACSDPEPEAPKQEETKPPLAQPVDGPALYLEHCSGCHGKTGDGQGETELKRPARSFAAGGFAFGNTAEALFKTITSGLPGISEMPSFADKLNEEERRAIVSHVRTLIPKQKQVDDTATIMIVEQKPLIFRGILPPLGKDLPLRPRGLLVGLPGGTTFEYRIDKPRLLAVRSGGFVKRTDWTGRAGTAAKPTGQVRYLFDGGNPGPIFHKIEASGIQALTSQMKGSFAFDDLAGISYDLIEAKSKSKVTIKEALFGQSLTDAFGFGRRFLVGPAKHDLVLRFDTGADGQTWVGRDLEGSDKDQNFPSVPFNSLKPVVRRNADGSALIIVHQGVDDLRIGHRSNALEIKLKASAEPQDLVLIFIQVEKYSIESLEKLAGEVTW
ncbi:MAG: mono/diheme cytochrome c family protein [Planctomycetota bacterium]|jgi:mono/diheme cytochrome c family protein